VTSGGARRGRRDNGLVAAAYAAAGDVDPRVGEHLLDVLAVRGIAAYLQPAADMHPVTRATMLSARPTDRLFVDREHLDTARRYLAQLADESVTEAGPAQAPAHQPDIDELFAGIVAGYDHPVESATWPAAEDLDDGIPTERTEPATPRLRRWRDSTVEPVVTPEEPILDDMVDEDDDLDEEGYTPPPPPPLPRISPFAIVAILAIVAGFVLFFNPELLPVGDAVSMTLGFLSILGGFVTLVWRLRPGSDDDDWDPDDGAVV
jgi:hypothetical protein